MEKTRNGEEDVEEKVRKIRFPPLLRITFIKFLKYNYLYYELMREQLAKHF